MSDRKKSYKKPEVKLLGSVSEVTAGGTGSVAEAMPGQGNPMQFS